MKVLTVLFLLAISAQASAKNRVELLLESKSGKTPYEILKEFHESEGRRAEISEMNSFDADKDLTHMPYTCAKAYYYDSSPQPTPLFVFHKSKIIPGIPASGPLFPGTPEKIIRRTGISADLSITVFQDSMNGMLNATTITPKEDEMIYELNYGSFYSFFNVRKHGDLISFSSFQVSNDQKPEFEMYGYCWIE